MRRCPPHGVDRGRSAGSSGGGSYSARSATWWLSTPARKHDPGAPRPTRACVSRRPAISHARRASAAGRRSHSVAVPSSWPATRPASPGRNIGTAVLPLALGSAPSACPFATSKSRTVPSRPPAASTAESGLKATHTASASSTKSVAGAHVFVEYRWTRRCRSPMASSRPSGLNREYETPPGSQITLARRRARTSQISIRSWNTRSLSACTLSQRPSGLSCPSLAPLIAELDRRAEAASVRQRPEVDHAVRARRGQQPPVGAHARGPDRVVGHVAAGIAVALRVPAQPLDDGRAVGVDQRDPAVAAADHEQMGAWHEPDARDDSRAGDAGLHARPARSRAAAASACR